MHPKNILLGIVAAAMTLAVGGATADASGGGPAPIIHETVKAEITDVYVMQPYVVPPYVVRAGNAPGQFTLFDAPGEPIVYRCLGEPLPFQSDNERRDAIATGGGVPPAPGVC